MNGTSTLTDQQWAPVETKAACLAADGKRPAGRPCHSCRPVNGRNPAGGIS